MIKLAFSGVLPDTDPGKELFRKTIETFNSLKAFLLESRASKREIDNEELSARFNADYFMAEDIRSAINGDVHPEVDIHSPCVFWSLGRHRPRLGMPWAQLALDDRDNCSLGIRWGGSFDDDEDLPKWVSCRIVIDTADLATILFASFTRDVWLTLSGDQLSGTIVLTQAPVPLGGGLALSVPKSP